MPIEIGPSKIPVLLLFNIDPEWSAQDQEEVLELTSKLNEAIGSTGHKTTLVPVTNNDLDITLAPFSPHDYIVFNWCESIPGIDHSEWLVPEFLEQRGFAFTGASAATIELSQDKFLVKKILDESGIPTPRWQIYGNTEKIGWNRYPAIVKASREHCSEGLDRNAVVMNEEELKKRIDYIVNQYKQPALVEDFIDGRELHISLWGNGKISMLPPAEMEFSFFTDEHDRICSYEAKFVPESEQYQKIKTVLPAALTDEELNDIDQVCKATYYAIGCRDYARIDLRMKDGLLYVIDINPNADISPDTTTVSGAEYAGYSYGEFGSRIISFAALRHPVWGDHVYATARKANRAAH